MNTSWAPGTGYSSSSPPTRQAGCQRRTDTGWRIEAARPAPVAAQFSLFWMPKLRVTNDAARAPNGGYLKSSADNAW